MTKKKSATFKFICMLFSMIVNLAIIVFLIEGFTYSFGFTYRMFNDAPKNAADKTTVTVSVLEDSSSRDIIDLVYDSGVVEDKYVFMAKTYLEGYYKKMKPGVYELSQSMTNSQILQLLTGQTKEE